MLKKINSTIVLLAMVFGAMLTINAQDAPPYAMWETIMLTPDNTQLKVLSENMRKHNQTYHGAGVHKSTVWSIATGPNVGKLVWQMGPTTYTHLDNRPAEGGHDEDWRDNVMPYIKKMHTAEYWKAHASIGNTDMIAPGAITYPILFIRFWEIEPGQGFSINTFFTRVQNTVKALDGENPWGLYTNEFRQGDLGRHLASISFMKTWAELDIDVNWVETFNKVNGNNAWQNQQNMGRTTFKNSWDEIWVYDKNMSGD
ncbi:MAG: hypothetical protein KJO77_06370 [Bacteroidia bacterium]|nr:hypothetical protein [Bacteroidia bacterium]NND52841.1 hypothetical protein [Flavobacteriaceae bacterium]